MSDLQKEDNKETEASKEEGSVDAQTPLMERTFAKEQWSAELVRQTDEHVVFKIYCKDTDRTWYQLVVRCNKNKFKEVGA